MGQVFEREEFDSSDVKTHAPETMRPMINPVNVRPVPIKGPDQRMPTTLSSAYMGPEGYPDYWHLHINSSMPNERDINWMMRYHRHGTVGNMPTVLHKQKSDKQSSTTNVFR